MQLPLALKAEPVECLWFNVVPFEELEDAGEQIFLVAWVSIEAASKAIKYEVLLLRGFLQVSDQ